MGEHMANGLAERGILIVENDAAPFKMLLANLNGASPAGWWHA